MAAVKKVLGSPDLRCVPYNLGTGTGTTVLEMVRGWGPAGRGGRGRVGLLRLGRCCQPASMGQPASMRRRRYRRCSRHPTTAITRTPAQVHAFEEASGLKVNLNLTGRRPGDATAVWAATDTAEKELGWKAKLTVKEMCRDQWAWVRGWGAAGPGRGARQCDGAGGVAELA